MKEVVLEFIRIFYFLLFNNDISYDLVIFLVLVLLYFVTLKFLNLRTNYCIVVLTIDHVFNILYKINYVGNGLNYKAVHVIRGQSTSCIF